MEGVKCLLASLVVMLSFSNTEGETFIDKLQVELLDNIVSLKSSNVVIPPSMGDELMFNLLSYYSPVDAESSRCLNDSIKYVEAALNNEIWALKMLDASSKLPSGLFEGNIQTLGNYDSCIQIDSSASPNQFTGQMCMVQIVGPKVLKMIGEQRGEAVFPVLIALCVPSSCTHEDVKTHMDVALKPLNASSIVGANYCATRIKEPLVKADYIAMCTICAILFLVILSTFYDFVFPSTDKEMKSPLSAFSLSRNLPKLSTRTHPDELSTLNGVRVLAIIWIVFGHRYFIELTLPIFGSTQQQYYLKKGFMTPFISFQLGVEIFLLLSGLLVTYNFLKTKKNNDTFNVWTFYVHRYMRITPVFAAMVLVLVLMYHSASGPLWKTEMGRERGNCLDNWWMGFTYIANYLLYGDTLNKMCFGQSWYLNTDMQLYVLSPLLLIPLYKKPKFGILLICCCFFATVSAAFVNANSLKLRAGSFLQAKLDVRKNFNYEYTKTHLRAGSYFIGMLLGYAIHKTKQGSVKMNLSKVCLLVGWLGSITLLVGTFYIINLLQQEDSHFNQYVDSLHIALNRPAFSLGLSWIIFIGIAGYGGFVNRFLCLPIFKPLATLTYCMYMTHLTFMMFELFQMKVPVLVTPLSLIVHGLGDFAVTLFLSTVMYLTVEAPFTELDKWIFSESEQITKEGIKVMPELITSDTKF